MTSGVPVHCLSPYALERRAFSSTSSSSSGSSKNGGDDQETVSETRAEVETLAQESRTDQWGDGGKLIYEGSIAHQVRGLKR